MEEREEQESKEEVEEAYMEVQSGRYVRVIDVPVSVSPPSPSCHIPCLPLPLVSPLTDRGRHLQTCRVRKARKRRKKSAPMGEGGVKT